MSVRKLRIKKMPIETGKIVAILHKNDAEKLGVRALERIRIFCKEAEIVAIIDVTDKFAKEGEILLSQDCFEKYRIKEGEIAEIKPEGRPESVKYIRKKLEGMYLSYHEIEKIIKDVVEKKLSEIEITAFLTALHIRGISMEEAENLTRAMVKTGKTIKFKNKPIVDKHSIGGVPGDKTSLVLVPIVASANLTIPKTSSRAITSPAGTADRMECIAPVEFEIDEIVRIVNKTNACLVWGGALELAPADDIFIQIEFPLGIDPMLFPSIMSKKKSVGSEYVVIDIPTGQGAKIKTVEEAEDLAEDFIELGKRLGMHVECVSTFGEQPIGHAIGPALEAREALSTLYGKGPKDLIDKACTLAGTIFRMVRKGDKNTALRILKSGKALKKFMEIVKEQGGNDKIKAKDIPVGDKKLDVRANKSGRILRIFNHKIVAIAKEAGAPKYKGAGIYLYKKMGDVVKKGEKLFTIFSEKSTKLNSAEKLLEEEFPIVIGKQYGEEMMLKSIPSKEIKEKEFILER